MEVRVKLIGFGKLESNIEKGIKRHIVDRFSTVKNKIRGISQGTQIEIRIQKRKNSMEATALLVKENRIILRVSNSRERTVNLAVGKLKSELLIALEKCKQKTRLIDHNNAGISVR